MRISSSLLILEFNVVSSIIVLLNFLLHVFGLVVIWSLDDLNLQMLLELSFNCCLTKLHDFPTTSRNLLRWHWWVELFVFLVRRVKHRRYDRRHSMLVFNFPARLIIEKLYSYRLHIHSGMEYSTIAPLRAHPRNHFPPWGSLCSQCSFWDGKYRVLIMCWLYFVKTSSFSKMLYRMS